MMPNTGTTAPSTVTNSFTAKIQLGLHRCSSCGKAMNRRRPENFAGPEYHRWKMGIVNRIGEMLRLQTNGVVLAVKFSAFAPRVLEVVGGVKLDCRLIGQHFHDPAGLRFINAGGQRQFFAAP